VIIFVCLTARATSLAHIPMPQGARNQQSNGEAVDYWAP
jgi:hypothetical protein